MAVPLWVTSPVVAQDSGTDTVGTAAALCDRSTAAPAVAVISATTTAIAGARQCAARVPRSSLTGSSWHPRPKQGARSGRLGRTPQIW
jgi:hypothetical protein